ncbi:adenylate/guanylate cyclase domain-containing protein [Deltaproteobacteria bacterium TL4]
MDTKILKKLFISLVLSAISISLALSLYYAGKLESLEMNTFDFRMQARTEHIEAHPDVVMLMIDEASLQSIQSLVGRWPWPRTLFAELVEFLTQAEAKAILFDVLFTEPQVPRSPEGELGADDMMLASSTAGSGATFHATQFVKDVEDSVNKSLLNRPLPEDFTEMFALRNLQQDPSAALPEYNNYYLPITEYYQSSLGVGVVEFSSDKDGIYRRSHLIRKYGEHAFPVLSLSLMQQILGVKQMKLSARSLFLDNLRIPLQKDGSYLINMKRKFTTYSLGGVFSTMQKLNKGQRAGALLDPVIFQNKIVLIGASAAGVEDLKHTSMGSNVPGVLLHGSIISNILQEDFIKNVPDWVMILSVLGLSFLTVSMVLLLNHVFFQVLGPLMIAIGFSMFSLWIFLQYQIWIPMIPPLLAWSLSFVEVFGFLSATEGREKRFIKGAFQQYLSPAVIHNLMENPGQLTLGGEEKELTAMFSDVKGFSTISEMLTPTELVSLLNEYLSEMTEIIMKYDGTVDKFEGDAIIAFFGAPFYLQDHAKRAALVMLEMQNRLAQLRDGWKEKWGVNIHHRIGVNTGMMVVGNMGSRNRFDYTIMGNSVNLAARLEGVNKMYGTDLIISEMTYEQCRDAVVTRELDLIRVIGIHKPVRIHELVSRQGELSLHLIKAYGLYAEALEAYRQQRWSDALTTFKQVLAMIPEDGPSKVLIQRCEHYLKEPPAPNWDGVYTATSK